MPILKPVIRKSYGWIIVGILMLSIITLTSNINNVKAINETGGARVTLGVNEVISLTITGNNDDTECTTAGFTSCSDFGNIPPNQYVTTTSTVNVFTNSVDGYNLSVKANNHADMKTANADSIPAGTLTSENGGQGVWSYKTDNTGIKTNWTPMTTTDTVIKGTSIYGETESSTTITYGVSTSNNQPAGEYEVELTYTATAPNNTDVVEPNPVVILKGDNVTLSASSIPISVGGTSTVTITPNEGYYLDAITCTNGYTTNATTGTSATSAQTVTITNPNVKRSAMCVVSVSKVKDITDLTSMQDLASHPDYCASTAEGVSTTVSDTRDNTTYTIAKLADGRCWMLDNLALDLTNSTVLNAMNEDNTHASNTTLGYLRNGGGTTSDQYATAGVSNWTQTTYTYSKPWVNLTNKDVVPTDSTSTAGNYKVGGYYNYCAATAGSYCYGDGTSEGTSSDNATEDICPKGWRLPTGKTSGEFSALANVIYGSTDTTSDATANADYRSALHLPLSGYFENGSAVSQGSSGYWWSSARDANRAMYFLYVNTRFITPAGSTSRFYGNSVRCVSE